VALEFNYLRQRMIQVYNGLTKKKEPLRTLNPNKVKMYVCGITVYDDCHIGHARTYIAFDLIIRYLRHRGYAVTYVRNITDIDDKIIKRAHERHIDPNQLVDEYVTRMYEDFDALNIARPDYEPRATETIPEMVAFIEGLIEKGYAYAASNGDVYFRVGAFEGYGKLSGQNLESLRSGIRVEISEVKENPLDFTLWKASKPGEPEWDSPWSKGRPGWHIECSAMSKKILGETFDIHGGGSDLRFPHHENEIAQSEAGNGCTFANTWMHSGMVQVDAEKMSKSLNNFFTIKEVLKAYPAEVVRYFLISGHYRSEINYSEENLDHARAAVTKLYSALRGVEVSPDMPNTTNYIDQFKVAMDNDFNTPEALSVIFSVAKELNRLKSEANTKEANMEVRAEASKYARLLVTLGEVLGILQNDPELYFKEGDDDASLIEDLIKRRAEAKKSKNWSEADAVRDELKAMGVLLEDTSTGTVWKREK